MSATSRAIGHRSNLVTVSYLVGERDISHIYMGERLITYGRLEGIPRWEKGESREVVETLEEQFYVSAHCSGMLGIC